MLWQRCALPYQRIQIIKVIKVIKLKRNRPIPSLWMSGTAWAHDIPAARAPPWWLGGLTTLCPGMCHLGLSRLSPLPREELGLEDRRWESRRDAYNLTANLTRASSQPISGLTDLQSFILQRFPCRFGQLCFFSPCVVHLLLVHRLHQLACKGNCPSWL